MSCRQGHIALEFSGAAHCGLHQALHPPSGKLSTTYSLASAIRQIINSAAHHVHGLGDVGEKVSDAPALLNVVLGVGLQGVDHVRELDAVADKEHREVIAHQIPVPLARVEFDLQGAGDITSRPRLLVLLESLPSEEVRRGA